MIWSSPKPALDATEVERLIRERDEAISERDAACKALSAIRPLYCSFCGKSQHDVSQLIAGPSVFICDECVALCMGIVEEAKARADEDQPGETWQPKQGETG